MSNDGLMPQQSRGERAPEADSRASYPSVPAKIHPYADLLNVSPEDVLEFYRQQQRRDFLAFCETLSQEGQTVMDRVPGLKHLPRTSAKDALEGALSREALTSVFTELHDHVLGHPVWLHPFFRRFFAAEFDEPQLRRFLSQYLNQIKNTRQCVALALGRLHTLAMTSDLHLSEHVSELSQIVLAGILADEYGVEAAPTELSEDGSDLEDVLAQIFRPVTHIGLYRKLFVPLRIDLIDQDEPMLSGVADNCLTQRAVAGDPRFTTIEALASVGMGMEWGVPSFFSMLLAGLLKHSHQREDLSIEPEHLQVLTGHVQQDVEHGIATMLVGAMWMRTAEDLRAAKQATSMLMGARYQMLSDIYTHVFDEPCANIDEIGLDERYHVRDRRIVDCLREARARTSSVMLFDRDAYVNSGFMPFVFAPEAKVA